MCTRPWHVVCVFPVFSKKSVSLTKMKKKRKKEETKRRNENLQLRGLRQKRGKTEERTKEGRKEVGKEGRKEGGKEGRKEGRKERRKEGRKDGWIEEKKMHLILLTTS